MLTQTTLDFDAAEQTAPRLSRQQQLILHRLRDGAADSIELNAICFRYGGRIHELRRLGYAISGKRLKQGVWLYQLEPNGEIR